MIQTGILITWHDSSHEITIVVPRELNPGDLNYASLAKNIELLDAWNQAHGSPFEVVELPMPAPFFLEGKRMPANYMNFYIGNRAVSLAHFWRSKR